MINIFLLMMLMVGALAVNDKHTTPLIFNAGALAVLISGVCLILRLLWAVSE